MYTHIINRWRNETQCMKIKIHNYVVSKRHINCNRIRIEKVTKAMEPLRDVKIENSKN